MKKTMWKKYRKTGVVEMTPVDEEIRLLYGIFGALWVDEDRKYKVSISDADLKNGSPKVGDMLARNPENPNDWWLVAKEFFEENYEEI